MMTALNGKVQMLNVKSVYNTIQTFLNEKGDRSNNTRLAYEKDIKNYFQIMLGKELSQLTVNDLGFCKEDILNYRTYLKDLKKEDGKFKYKAKSINRYIDSVRSLFTELRENGYAEYVDEYAFKFDNLPENDTERAGELTEEEFELFEEKALGLHNGLMKSLLIGLAARTSIRLSALLSLTWSDIKPIDHGEWKGNHIVDTLDKGNKRTEKIILDCFYQRLLALRVEGQEQLFTLSDTAVNNMIKRLCKLCGIDESRKVSFHSLKAVGINYVIDNGGNLEDARRQASHVNIQTTSKHYIRRTMDHGKSAGALMDSKLDTSALDGMSREELLALIRGTSKTVQRLIMAAYKEGKGR